MTVEWVILYFLYGQVFFVMGLVTGLQWRRHSRLELARALPWLTAFGIAHGLNEWGYIFVPLQTVSMPTNMATVVYLGHLMLLAVSFFFLFQFGVELPTPLFPKHRWLRDVPGAVLVLWLGALVLRAMWLQEPLDLILSIGDGWSRYFLCFPGAMLAAVGLYRQARRVREMGLPRIDRYLTGAAVAFAVYGLVGGLIVPTAPFLPASIINHDLLNQAIHVPAPVFRSLCGLAMAFFVTRSLTVFQAESDHRIAQIEQAHLLAADRERIGRELHDGTIQNIYAAGLGLEAAQHAIEGDPVQAQEQIQAVMATLNRTIQNIRTYIFDLYAEEQIVMLRGTLDDLVHELRLDAILDVDLQVCDLRCGKLTTAQTAHLIQIIREALSNIGQHAQATHATTSLHCEQGRMRLTITDDGIGMPATTTGPGAHQGRGISNMQARAALLQGEFAFESAPEQGTQITVLFPCGAEVGA